MGGRTERALVEEEPVATADFVERAFEPERALTPLDVDESHETGWPRLPRTASLPTVTPRPAPAEPPREYVFVSGASVVLPPSTSEPAPTRRRQRRRAHAAEEPSPDDERPRRDRRRRRRRRKPKGVSPLTSPTSSMNFPEWASPTSSIARASPRPSRRPGARRGRTSASSTTSPAATRRRRASGRRRRRSGRRRRPP